ncbi:MAG: hypothetical protein PVH31_05985 [Ectothiorhodospiraceae bacterium]|jgi:hypothetical protein
MYEEPNAYDEASRQTVELGNQIADADESAHLWDVADGLLAGAIQYWLYTRQPCGDASCEDCASICTADLRMQELTRLLREFAESSDYYHSPTDLDVGTA